MEGIKTGAVVVYFQNPTGIANAEVVVQELPEAEIGKVSAWKCRMVVLGSTTACQAYCASHDSLKRCPSTTGVVYLGLPALLPDC